MFFMPDDATTCGFAQAAGRRQRNWPGASGTDWWLEMERLAAVYLRATALRSHYRRNSDAGAYRAIIELRSAISKALKS
jgi:hypothetical protein